MTLSHLMNHPALVHLGLSLAHFLWQGAAIAMLLAVALFATRRRSPELRHGLCLFAMLAMALCPAGTLWYFHANPPTGLTLTSALNPEPEAQARDHNQPEAQARDNNQPEAQARDNNQPEAQARDHSAPARALEFALLATDSETRPGAMPTRGASELATATEPPAARGHAANAENVGLATEPRTQPPDATPDARPTPSASDLATATASPAAGGPAVRVDAPAPRTPRLAWGLTIAAIAWAVGVTLLGIRFVFAWLGLCRLRRGTESLPEAIARIADRLRAAMGLRANVPVRISRAVREPIAFGLLRPIVLVPASLLTGCPAEMLEAVIAHELAHIRRHDLWINLLQRAIETLLFYHPAVWWVSGRLRLERELCCDDLAVRATGRRADYAGALVELSGTLHGWAPPILTAGMFTSRLSLPARVRRILQVPSTTLDPNRGRYWMAGPLTLLLAGTLILAATLHTGIAKEPAATNQIVVTGKPEQFKEVEHWLAELEKNPATQPAAPRSKSPIQNKTINPGWQSVPMEQMLNEFGEMAGVGVAGVDRIEKSTRQRPITFSAAVPMPFDEALTALDRELFEVNYWIVLKENQLFIRPLSEWYRHIPPENVFMSQDEYRKAALPGWDVASVVYDPKVWPAEALAGIANDSVPLNGGRATISTDGRRLVLTGFVTFLDQQLQILKKWDAPPAPESGKKPLATARPTPDAPKPTASGIPVRPLANGIVAEVLVEPGQLVKKGDLLVRLDDAEARIELEAAMARLKPIKKDYEWYKPHHEAGRSIGKDWTQLESDFTVANLEIQKWKLRLERSQIHSPADGVVRLPDDLQSPEPLIGKAVTAGETLMYVERQDAIRAPVPTRPAGEPSGAMDGPMRGMDFSGPSDRMGSAPGLPDGAVQILAPSAGVIEQVRVKPGQQVKKGDVLVKFDTQDLELELKAAEIRLKATKEQLEIAEQQHKRGLIQFEEVSKLLEKEAISQLELERIKLRLERASIRSPIDGHVFGDESFQFLEGRFVEAGHPLSLFIRPATQTQPAGRGVEAP